LKGLSVSRGRGVYPSHKAGKDLAISARRDRKESFVVPASSVHLSHGKPVGLTFCCPRCQRTSRLDVAAGDTVHCGGCGWERATSAANFSRDKPVSCLACGCDDLWRQKNFSPRIGLLMVGSAILLSTIAYAFWQPVLAIGVLMGFALIDALLYLFMQDISVCYRCAARHGGFELDNAQHTFDLEVAERYRQERLRRQALSKAST
jgi:hypothetical protein